MKGWKQMLEQKYRLRAEALARAEATEVLNRKPNDTATIAELRKAPLVRVYRSRQ
jgi:hypothetical protein